MTATTPTMKMTPPPRTCQSRCTRTATWRVTWSRDGRERERFVCQMHYDNEFAGLDLPNIHAEKLA